MKKLIHAVAIPLLFLLVTLPAIAQKDGATMKYIDPSNMDLSVKPGDNFYLYANGNWLKNNPVPASKTRWGSFDVLRQSSLDKLKLLTTEAAANTSKNSIYQRVGD
ncbi:MAG: M13 family peptidase, partial [Bacteroidota bacterium]